MANEVTYCSYHPYDFSPQSFLIPRTVVQGLVALLFAAVPPKSRTLTGGVYPLRSHGAPLIAGPPSLQPAP